MSTEEAIEAAAELLRPWLASAKLRDGSAVRKLILGTEHADLLLHPARLQVAINEASNDAEVDAVLCGFGAACVEMDENMPKPLRVYIAAKLRSFASAKAKGKRGKHPYVNLTRDFAIAYVVARLSERGFLPTRNREQRAAESACSLTVMALKKVGVHMSEEAVEKIWGNRSRIPSNLRQYIDEGKEDLPHGFRLGRIVGN